jgi:hypothetical protein
MFCRAFPCSITWYRAPEQWILGFLDTARVYQIYQIVQAHCRAAIRREEWPHALTCGLFAALFFATDTRLGTGVDWHYLVGNPHRIVMLGFFQRLGAVAEHAFEVTPVINPEEDMHADEHPQKYA